jgi:hypothetical protein
VTALRPVCPLLPQVFHQGRSAKVAVEHPQHFVRAMVCPAAEVQRTVFRIAKRELDNVLPEDAYP